LPCQREGRLDLEGDEPPFVLACAAGHFSATWQRELIEFAADDGDSDFYDSQDDSDADAGAYNGFGFFGGGGCDCAECRALWGYDDGEEEEEEEEEGAAEE
jgi:hypothetical protein